MLWQPGRTMEYELLVDGNHLREGLRIFKLRRKLRATDKATVAYADGFVIINALDRGFVARAAGLWPGIAQAGASMVMALARVPPIGDEIRVRFAEGKLRIGSVGVAAQWMPASSALLDVPAAPDWAGALSLKFRVPPPEAVARGYTSQIAEAERKLGLLLARVTRLLSPLGVTEDDLRTLVERRISERWGMPPDKAAAAPQRPIDDVS